MEAMLSVHQKEKIALKPCPLEIINFFSVRSAISIPLPHFFFFFFFKKTKILVETFVLEGVYQIDDIQGFYREIYFIKTKALNLRVGRVK